VQEDDGVDAQMMRTVVGMALAMEGGDAVGLWAFEPDVRRDFREFIIATFAVVLGLARSVARYEGWSTRDVLLEYAHGAALEDDS
jgi:hypothetical protein